MSIDWTLATATLSRPTGGDIALFELANALARRPGAAVTIVHMPFRGSAVASLADVPWMEFDPTIAHVFAPDLEPARLPPADVLLYTVKLVASAVAAPGASSHALVEQLRAAHELGVRLQFVQGLGVFGDEVEALALALPGVKVCVGSRLVESLHQRGVPRDDAVHVPNGLDHRTFHVIEEIETRTPRVAMNYDPHPAKAGPVGIEALTRANRALGVPATVFGTTTPDGALPADVRFVGALTREDLASTVYNASTVYLQPSRQEGFGMCAVEAMACGCALVTTDNGGSADYAVDGETALVCAADPGELSDAIVRLVRDDRLRIRLARNGREYVQRFRWEESARRLDELAIARSRPIST